MSFKCIFCGKLLDTEAAADRHERRHLRPLDLDPDAAAEGIYFPTESGRL